MNDAQQQRANELISHVEAAVREALRNFESELPGETIAAYALVVDGGFQSILAACCTGTFFRRTGYESLYDPSGWDREDYSASLERAGRSLEALADALRDRAYDERVPVVVAALGEALEKVRAASPALRNAFLSVSAADGSDVWYACEDVWVERLNGPEVYAEWKARLEEIMSSGS